MAEENARGEDVVPEQSPVPRLTAGPTRPPEPHCDLQNMLAAHQVYVREREGLERRSMLRGLLVLAVVVLLVSFARAGLDRVFVHGWWNQW